MPESSQHSQRLSDAAYYALVNAVTSRFDCDRVGRGIVDREGMRAEFDRVLAGLFEQLETLRQERRLASALAYTALAYRGDDIGTLTSSLEALIEVLGGNAAMFDRVIDQLAVKAEQRGVSFPAMCPDCRGFGMSDVETGEPSRVKTLSVEECFTCDGAGRVSYQDTSGDG